MNAEALLRKMVKERRSRVEMAAALGITTATLSTRLAELRIRLPTRRHTIEEIERAWRKAGGPEKRGACSRAAVELKVTRQQVHSRLLAAGIIEKREQPA